MSGHVITRDEVIERSRALPAFPLVINHILETLDDVDANMNVLVNHIKQDSLMEARIISLANRSATRTQYLPSNHNIYSATSMIGTNRVRQLALLSCIGSFADDIIANSTTTMFWRHSVSVGVCCEELAYSTSVPSSAAQVAGLLHDIGQLWLDRFDSAALGEAWNNALSHSIGIEVAERERFGIDHATIGAWLAEYWSLPAGVVDAIRYHHAPEPGLEEPLVPLVHVAEVLSNALDLMGRPENRVSTISTPAFEKLGLVLDADIHPLFGRIMARSRHATAWFK